MSPTALIRELHRRDPLLAAAGWVMVAGLAAAAVAATIDTRQILGLNPWIKPMKFLSSIAIFLWTMGWFMPEAAPGSARRVGIVRKTVVAMMSGEILLIALQAARGTTSHFNVATVFDAAVFNTMGAMIVINTLAVAAFLTTLRRDVAPARAGYVWGIRAGVLLFVVGSSLGFVMVAHMGHTVPLPDGGPGLPFVNWSTASGDLRIAHFLGLHALQALPLAGYLLDTFSDAAPGVRRGLVSTAAITWGGVVAVTLWMALTARPLFAI